jgi:DnaJ-class molecular chaperone
MTPQDKIDRIWCDVYARAFHEMAKNKGFFAGYEPVYACSEARRIADAAVVRLEGHPERCPDCNGTGQAPATDTGNPDGERTYGDCSECGGTGRDP